jgi:ribonuclease HII
MSHYPVVLGIDEAGLGPILGPLTVGYAAFRLPRALTGDGVLHLDLWDPLALGREPAERKLRAVVCDSKRIYTSGKIKPLEEEVLCWSAIAGAPTDDFDAFRAALCPLGQGRCDDYDWYTAPPPFPLEADEARMRLRAQPIKRAMDNAGIQLEGVGVVPLLEGEFNRLLGRVKSKARAELECITRILGHFWQRHTQLAVLVDRQGGRTRYARSLANEFPEARVNVLHESTKLSTYELSIPEVQGHPRMFIAFVEKGDGNHLPIALASMFAKYMRELHMHQFNQWWAQHDAALKPTAGYYSDGRRWLQDTAALRAAIGVDENRLVRRK